MEEAIDYMVIEFNKDSTSVFSGKSDTILRYNYWIKDSILVLVDENNDTTRNKIIRLDKRYLTLNSVRRISKIRHYQKVN